MLKLSKKAEYAILAVQYLAEHPGDKLNAKEIAANLDISFEFLSKTMQSLMKSGLVSSIQGVKGGYVLSKLPDSITLMEIINATDEKIGVVDCMNSSDEDCSRNDNCAIKNPMHKIQMLIDGIFNHTSVNDLISDKYIKNINIYHSEIMDLKKIV